MVGLAKGIGILDSGVGGLTVVSEVFRQLPRVEVIYIGDSARCPYGPRPYTEIRQFSLEMVKFLMQFEPTALVIACNTITAVLLEELREWLTIPVIGVIEPGARAAIRVTKNNIIGVIGTQGTIDSGSYEKALHRANPDLNVSSLACPNLVTLVESGAIHTMEAMKVVNKELSSLQGTNIDTLIMGCTHYPIIAPLIRQSIGDDVMLISSAEETASELSLILAQEGQLDPMDDDEPNHHFYTTGDTMSFQSIAEEWLKRSILVEQVALN